MSGALIVSKRCKVCKGKTFDGKDIRPTLELMRGQGKTFKEMIDWAYENGAEVSPLNLSMHFKNHAPYAMKGTILPKETQKAVTTLTHSSESAKSVIRKIIGRGEEMLDNWWRMQQGEEVTGPTMPITPKLLLGAMEQDIKRAPKTALDTDIESLTRAAIEGESVEGEIVDESDSAS